MLQRERQRSLYSKAFSTESDCSLLLPPCRRTKLTRKLTSFCRNAVNPKRKLAGCWRQRGRRFGEQPETHSTPIKQFEGRQSCQLQPKVRDSSILSHLAPTSWPVLGARISKAVSGSMLQWNSHTQPTRCI